MTLKNHLFLKVILFFILIALIPGCSRHQTPRSLSSSDHKEVLRIPLQQAPTSLDPRYGVDARSQIVIRALFEGLTRVGKDGEVHLAAAETVETKEEGKVYTFRLRPCHWSSGDELEANDFLYAWKTLLSSPAPGAFTDLFYIIKNAQAILEKKLPVESLGVTVLSKNVLQIELERAEPHFLHLLSMPLFFPVSQKQDQKCPEWAHPQKGAFVCNGPFCLKEWKVETHLTLKKNPSYHDSKAVQLEEIYFPLIPDPQTAFLLFEKGEIDWVGDPFTKLPLEVIPQVQQEGLLQISPHTGIFWLICNTQTAPLHSRSLRKALSYAISRDSLIQHLFIGHECALRMVSPLFEVPSLSEKKLPNDDEEKAREFLAQTAQGENPLRLTLTYSTIPGHRFVVQVIQQIWEKNLGIKVDLKQCEWNSYMETLQKGEFQIAPIGWICPYKDPLYHLQVFKDRQQPSNWGQWTHPDYTHLIEEASQCSQMEERLACLAKAEEILIEELPVIPLCFSAFKYLKKEEIGGVVLTQWGEVDFKWAFLKSPPSPIVHQKKELVRPLKDAQE